MNEHNRRPASVPQPQAEQATTGQIGGIGLTREHNAIVTSATSTAHRAIPRARSVASTDAPSRHPEAPSQALQTRVMAPVGPVLGCLSEWRPAVRAVRGCNRTSAPRGPYALRAGPRTCAGRCLASAAACIDEFQRAEAGQWPVHEEDFDREVWLDVRLA